MLFEDGRGELCAEIDPGQRQLASAAQSDQLEGHARQGAGGAGRDLAVH